MALLLLEAVYYVRSTPSTRFTSMSSIRGNTRLGYLAYEVASILSILRSPFSLAPYITKLLLFFFWKTYHSTRNTYRREALRITAEVLQFVIVGLLLLFL